jgi:hypothetical protein
LRESKNSFPIRFIFFTIKITREEVEIVLTKKKLKYYEISNNGWSFRVLKVGKKPFQECSRILHLFFATNGKKTLA